nr:MAG TPA: Helix-turn-helix XRE-family like protein [Caudoviricetes sp.]
MEISVKISYKNEKLQNARQTAGMSQSQLARAAGISVRVLQDYERGARDISGAKLATLLKLCNALHCELRDIIADPETIELLDAYGKNK